MEEEKRDNEYIGQKEELLEGLRKWKRRDMKNTKSEGTEEKEVEQEGK